MLPIHQTTNRGTVSVLTTFHIAAQDEVLRELMDKTCRASDRTAVINLYSSCAEASMLISRATDVSNTFAVIALSAVPTEDEALLLLTLHHCHINVILLTDFNEHTRRLYRLYERVITGIINTHPPNSNHEIRQSLRTMLDQLLANSLISLVTRRGSTQPRTVGFDPQ